MNKYWRVNGDFGNTYNLFWTCGEEMEKALPKDAYRITRKQAIDDCIAERCRRKKEPNFSGYADAYIYPAGVDNSDEYYEYDIDCGYIAIKKLNTTHIWEG